MTIYELLAISICDEFPIQVERYKNTNIGVGKLLGILLARHKTKISPQKMYAALKEELESRKDEKRTSK